MTTSISSTCQGPSFVTWNLVNQTNVIFDFSFVKDISGFVNCPTTFILVICLFYGHEISQFKNLTKKPNSSVLISTYLQALLYEKWFVFKLYWADQKGAHLECVGNPWPDVCQGSHGTLAQDLTSVPDSFRLNWRPDWDLGSLNQLDLKDKIIILLW